MLRTISSELRSPITIIQSNLQLLKKFCNCSDVSLLNEAFSFSEDSIESILGFIERINFICSSDNNRIKLQPEWFSLKLLINLIYAELKQPSIDISRIHLNFSVANYNIFHDKYMLSRILINLLSNALKFSNREVELFISISENKLSVVVRDYGIGIPENQVSEVFNPFVRGSNANLINGSGLGLSIVANAVKCISGSIAVNSEISKGTEFRIIIPLNNGISEPINKCRQNKLSGHFDISGSEYHQIVGAIFHELRTPLAIIKSNIQILKKVRLDIDEALKDESIFLCEESLKNIERIFDKIKLLNIAISSNENVHMPNSVINKLYINYYKN